MTRHTCRHCKGLGYIPVKGEAMAADPCGWCDEEIEERDPDAEREAMRDDAEYERRYGGDYDE